MEVEPTNAACAPSTATSDVLKKGCSSSVYYDTFKNAINKGADQYSRVRRLICASVVHTPRRQLLERRGPLIK